MYQRLMQSFVHIDRLWGAGAPVPAGRAASACAARLVSQAAGPRAGVGADAAAAAAAASSPGVLWDLLQLLSLPRWHAEEGPQQQQQAAAGIGEATAPMEVDEEGDAGAGARAPLPSQGQSQGPPAAAGAPAAAAAAAADAAPTAGPSELAGRVVADLEAPFLAALASAQGAGGASGLGRVPAPAWRGLQLATALRRALRPPEDEARPQAAVPAPPKPTATAGGVAASAGGAGAAAGPAAAVPLSDEWAAALDRNEMHLLQRHILRSLTAFLEGPAGQAQPAGGRGPAGGGAAPAESQGAALAPSLPPGPAVSQASALLMADWVLSNVSHPLFHQQLMEPAAR